LDLGDTENGSRTRGWRVPAGRAGAEDDHVVIAVQLSLLTCLVLDSDRSATFARSLAV
jgi:hypothetical protein